MKTKDLLRENNRRVRARTAQGNALGLAAAFVEASLESVGLEELVLAL